MTEHEQNKSYFKLTLSELLLIWAFPVFMCLGYVINKLYIYSYSRT